MWKGGINASTQSLEVSNSALRTDFWFPVFERRLGKFSFHKPGPSLEGKSERRGEVDANYQGRERRRV